MVSKCHNPRCSAEFRYFGEGKLFEFPPDSVHETSELYWLCATCHQQHSLERGQDGEIRLIAKVDGTVEQNVVRPRLDRAS
jgi:hypothetical protein